MAQLSIAWCCKNKDVSVCLFGASRIEMLIDNLKCIDVIPKLTAEVEKDIEAIWETKPAQETDYSTFKPLPDRR